MEALIPGRGRHAVYSALALFDTQWMAAQADGILEATPQLGDQLINVIKARFPPEMREPVIEKLRTLMAGKPGPN
jgi:hypothetical protein